MRWDRLFDDLEAQAAAAEAGELAGEVDERIRIEHGRTVLLDRFRAARGLAVEIAAGGERFSGVVSRVAADAVVLELAARREVLFTVYGIDRVVGLPRGVRPSDAGRVAAGFGLRALLRDLARDRAAVQLRLRDSAALAGTIDAVGNDWLELAEHPADAPRRPATVERVSVVPLSAIVSVALV